MSEVFGKPPTDNIYKFFAILGLIVFIGAPAYWVALYNKTMHLREIRDSVEPIASSTDIQWLKNYRDTLGHSQELVNMYAQALADASAEKSNLLQLHSLPKKPLSKETTELFKRFDEELGSMDSNNVTRAVEAFMITNNASDFMDYRIEHYSSLYEMHLRECENDLTASKELDEYINERAKYNVQELSFCDYYTLTPFVCGLITSLGGGLSLLGFRAWFRLQKYSDIILENKARIVELERQLAEGNDFMSNRKKKSPKSGKEEVDDGDEDSDEPDVE